MKNKKIYYLFIKNFCQRKNLGKIWGKLCQLLTAQVKKEPEKENTVF